MELQFRNWLAGIVSRVSAQQTIFSAIYEPVRSANNTDDNTGSIGNEKNKESEKDERPSGLRLAAVIGKSTVAVTRSNKSTTDSNNETKEDLKAGKQIRNLFILEFPLFNHYQIKCFRSNAKRILLSHVLFPPECQK